MNSSITDAVRAAAPNDFIHVTDLLRSENLPVEDISTELSGFFVIEDDGKVVAAIGLEIYGAKGLLRSMVVAPEYRNKSLADVLLNRLFLHASEQGTKSLYLITTTAEKYFLKKGFQRIDREQVPASIKSSREFTTLCPSTATVMTMEL
jgi:amino-acid N-acetyltransferase